MKLQNSNLQLQKLVKLLGGVMKKDFVSLQQTLSYLQFINTDKQAFADKSFKPIIQPTNDKNRDYDFRNKRLGSKQFDYSKNMDMPNNEENTNRKAFNKNRAIKRIIDTSKQILETNYKFQKPPPNDKKSYITQFNIYLKQYNRLSEQLIAQEQQKLQKRQQAQQKQQGYIQRVFQFTVSQDFREMIDVTILKDKINKGNVQMIMQTFKLKLVVLRSNQMRIYENQDDQSSHRDIKLHEIENVDYFSQPFIFTVMTIVKDKSLGNQFLCFRFDNLQRQHKWDRAVYCNFVSKKMKRRRHYFLTIFPEKQQQKQNNQGGGQILKKKDDYKSYQIDRKKIIKSIISEKQKEKQVTRMGSAGMDTERDFPTTQKRFQRNNTQNPMIISPSRQNNYTLMSTKNAEQKPFFDSNLKNSIHGRKKDSMQEVQQNQQQLNQKPNSNNSNKSSTVKLNNNQISNSSPHHINTSPNPSINLSPNNQNSNNPNAFSRDTFKPAQPKVQESSSQENNGFINLMNNNNLVESQFEPQQTISKPSSKIINPFTKRKIQLRQKHQDGIKLQKIKFFIDKPKLMYLNNDCLEYWDYDQKTLHKSERKIINFSQLKIYRVFAKEKQMVIYFQLVSKNIQFLGKMQDINDIVQWIELQKKEKQFVQNKNVKSPDNKDEIIR